MGLSMEISRIDPTRRGRLREKCQVRGGHDARELLCHSTDSVRDTPMLRFALNLRSRIYLRNLSRFGQCPLLRHNQMLSKDC